MFISSLNNNTYDLNITNYINYTNHFSNTTKNNRIRNHNYNHNHEHETHSDYNGFPYGLLFLIIPMGIICMLCCYIYINDKIWKWKNRRILRPDRSPSISSTMSVSINSDSIYNGGIIKPTILFVKNVKEYIFNKENTKIDELCSICLEGLNNNDTIFKTDCNHFYHKQCIKPWIENQIEENSKIKCPMCRNIIDFEYKDKVNEEDKGVIV